MSSCRVAVIGAGPAGLVAARRSVNEGHRVVVYEQHSSVGGIWVFAEDPKHHSALYEDMKTNLPKEMMMYNGHPYPNELPSFMSSQNVGTFFSNLKIGSRSWIIWRSTPKDFRFALVQKSLMSLERTTSGRLNLRAWAKKKSRPLTLSLCAMGTTSSPGYRLIRPNLKVSFNNTIINVSRKTNSQPRL